MVSSLEIPIVDLKDGVIKKISLSCSSEFLEMSEPELFCEAPVRILGEAYVTEDHLILKLDASTAVRMPCIVCNEIIEAPLEAKQIYHAEPLPDVNASFNYSTFVREALLLELPHNVECPGGCVQRKAMAPFLAGKEKSEQDVHFPFADLDSI